MQLANLQVDEFDLRLDEGMVQWAQGLAERVLWNLVANRRVDEMGTWSLPEEAFCSLQVRFFVGLRSPVCIGRWLFVNNACSFEQLGVGGAVLTLQQSS